MKVCHRIVHRGTWNIAISEARKSQHAELHLRSVFLLLFFIFYTVVSKMHSNEVILFFL